MITIKVSKAKRSRNPMRPTRQQRRMLAAYRQPAHPNATYIIHHADADGWRGISRVPRHYTLSSFRAVQYKFRDVAWKYNIGECTSHYPYEGTSTNATHTVVLNTGDTFTCASMADVKRELRDRRA